jgi:hypothetical protein
MAAFFFCHPERSRGLSNYFQEKLEMSTALDMTKKMRVPRILFLAFRAPCSGSPANCRATQHRFVSRTFSPGAPAFMN